MAFNGVSNGTPVKQEPQSHFHDLYNRLHAQLSAEDTRNVDNNDSADDSGESPIDFSIKPKSKGYDEISGSDSISSPASSLNDTGGNLDDRKNDDDRGNNYNGSNDSTDSSPIHNLQHKRLGHHDSPLKLHIGEPRTGDHRKSPIDGSPGPGLPGMLSGLQMGLTNANLLANSFPAMSALMDPRRHVGGGSKNSRPFKAYPNDALSLALGTAGIPQYLTSFANFENSALTHGVNLSSEELFNIYKQQLLSLRERDKYFEALKQSQNAARSSTITSSPTNTTIPPSITSSITSPHFTKPNGINNNVVGSMPTIPLSSNSLSSPTIAYPRDELSDNSENSNNVNLTAAGRRRPRSLPDEQKDELYWERRRKNNEAAKRSRDARRAKEDQIAIRAALLEQENLKLRVEVAALKTETAKLRCMLYNS